jgi:hypothetical protein
MMAPTRPEQKGVAMAEAVDRLTAQIRGSDVQARTDAWFRAHEIGAPAVPALAGIMAEGDLEAVRAARNGLWRIVRHAGRSGADAQRQAVVAALIPLLEKGQATVVRREAVWMLSEIGGSESAGPVARLLAEAALREDARCALERIPGEASLRALRTALSRAPEDFKHNLAQSLRARGVAVAGLPCRKTIPTRTTGVKPLD